MTVLPYQRLDDIVDYLLVHTTNKIPLIKLKDLLKVSDRTIRNDIVTINDSIGDRHATIKLYRGEGYQLVFSNKEIFISWWNQQKKLGHGSSLLTQENRLDYLIYLLLYQQKPSSLDQLLDQLFISKNTFYSYLKSIKETLLLFDLKVYNRPNIGFEVLGSEFNKRQAIMSLLLKKDLENYLLDFSEMEYHLFESIDLELLKTTEVTYLQQLDLFESDYYHKNLLSTLALTITRIKQDFSLDSMPLKVPLPKKKLKKAFDPLIFQLETVFSVAFSPAEQEYLYFNVLTNFPRLADTSRETLEIQKVSRQIVSDLIHAIQESTSYNWVDDTVLREDLIAHVEGFVGLKLYQSNRSNPLLETIKTAFPLAYDLSLVNLEIIGHRYGIYFSEDEIGYIALHLAGAIERNEHQFSQKLKVAVICGSGLTMSKLISLKLEKKYPESLIIVGNYSFIELKEGVVPSVDLIISTIPIDYKKAPIKLISMNNLDRDLANLKTFIKDHHLNDSYLTKLFDSAHFHVFKDETSKEEILLKMCGELEKDGYVSENFYPSVMEREAIEATAINQNMAIPHPMALLSKKTIISVAIVPNGVTWNNDIAVRFIFLFSIQKRDYEKTDKVYDLLLAFLDDTKGQEELLQSPSFSNFYRKLRKLSI